MYPNKKRKVTDDRRGLNQKITNFASKFDNAGIHQTRMTNFFPKINNEQITVKTEPKANEKTKERALKGLTLATNAKTEIVKSKPKVTGDVSNDFKTFGTRKSAENRCPFHKKIPDTPFVVDCFNYGTIPGILIYFLSHFHSDHYIGLTSSFKLPLYCNKVTANLVKMKLRVKNEFVHVLPMDQPCVVHGIEVTLIDANHCPGSAMFVFRCPNGRTLLHTGDFRAHPEMEKNAVLKNTRINDVYLDTTYCKTMYQFPDQGLVIDSIVQMAKKYYKGDSQTLFVCGSYTIGKEKVFIAIARALGLKIWANTEKMRILNCLEDTLLSSLLTTNVYEADVHVLSFHQVNFEYLSEYLQKLRPRVSQIVGLKPTGWEFNTKASIKSTPDFKFRKQGNVTIYGIPYSEHSSYLELQRFVQFLQPDRIVPTVNVTGKSGQTGHELLLQLSKKSSEPQQTLDNWTVKRKLNSF